MAGRQLEKLRQWAGEVIATREKTTFSDEFKDLERDIEFRREGARRLHLATESYQTYLSKKKLNEALDEAEKLLPIDALGVVMIVHGEEYSEDSAFGNSLVKLGRAHCKIATLQEAFALALKDTVMTFLSRFEEEIKEYDAMRKKLESRRLSYDAALVKAEKCKNSKKEKERREAEEELERAQYRYEETMEDVRAHMYAIQENETAEHRELGSFLDAEINYVQQCLDVLTEVKFDWQTMSNSVRKRNSTRSQARPQRQAKYTSLGVPSSLRTDPVPPQLSSEDEDIIRPTPSRRSSSLRRKSENGGKPVSLPNSRSSSRAPSRMSRNRSDSSATTVGERDKDAEKEKVDKPRRKSVAGWASSAVGSVTSLGRKSKDRDRFSALQDRLDDDDGRNDSSPALQRSSSIRSVEKPFKQRKVVRALRDFQGSSDELSFKVGDEIIVVNEVLDEWWLGSLNSQTGLFPAAYVEVIPDRPQTAGAAGSEDGHTLSDPYDIGVSDDDIDPSSKPLSPHRSPFYAGFSDVMSITSSGHEDEESDLVPRKKKVEDVDINDSKWANPSAPPAFLRRSTTTDVNAFTMPVSLSTGAIKKAVPPPPPRRSMTVATVTMIPPIPERKLYGLRQSAPSSSTLSSQEKQHDYNESPFESSTDFANPF